MGRGAETDFCCAWDAGIENGAVGMEDAVGTCSGPDTRGRLGRVAADVVVGIGLTEGIGPELIEGGVTPAVGKGCEVILCMGCVAAAGVVGVRRGMG